jgi:hypothetical protein
VSKHNVQMAKRKRRGEGRADGTPPARQLGHEAERRTRPLSAEETWRSADLQRRYAAEYASMLRVVSDREVAKQAARVNLSALLLGQPRIVPSEGRFSVDPLRNALAHGGEDLGVSPAHCSRGASRAKCGTNPRGTRVEPVSVSH